VKVAVIVDDLDPSRRRRCFWEEQLATLPDVKYELVSLLANMEQRQFFNIYEYDVVIFNWCVLDGALMYASDRVQDIVDFYDDHFIQFVRRGGVVVMEDQPKRWRPVQRAYDILFPGQLAVMSRQNYSFGSTVIANNQFKNHPLLQGLGPKINSAYSQDPATSWFPPGSTSTKSIEELNPTKMYSGAFQKWQKEWLPLLHTEDGQHPVMLAKTEGLGLWIVTTMFLASSNVHHLIESVVVGSKRHNLAIRQFHATRARLRKLNAIGATLLACLLAVAVFLLLQSGIPIAKVPYGDTWAGNFGASILFAVTVSALALLRRFLSRTWRSARNR
jgi:hypothetical protein